MRIVAQEIFAKVRGEILLNLELSARMKAFFERAMASPLMMASLESGVENPALVLMPFVPKKPLVKLCCLIVENPPKDS